MKKNNQLLKIRGSALGLLLAFSLFAPGAVQGQPVGIGGHCPDIQLTHILNYPKEQMALSDFTSPLIILDFWGTGCEGCILSFGKLDALQKKFGDSIQIILVNRETEDSTRKFFLQHKKIKLPDVPFVTGDSLLSAYFPHSFVPHQVWLDSQRIVRAITGGYNATVTHIRTFLQSGKIQLSLKKDIAPVDSDLPLIALADSATLLTAQYYSYIMPAIKGLNKSYERTATERGGQPNHLVLNNASILRLFQTAFGEQGKYDFTPRNRIILQVSKPANYTYPTDDNQLDAWEKLHSYLYELCVPENQSGELYRYMQQDLCRYFKLRATVEKRKIACWVLVRTSNRLKLKKNEDSCKVSNIRTANGIVQSWENLPFSRFVWQFVSEFSDSNIPEPLIDGTGLDGNLKISFSGAGLYNEQTGGIDINQFRKILKSFDLDLKKKSLRTTVLLLRENP